MKKSMLFLFISTLFICCKNEDSKGDVFYSNGIKKLNCEKKIIVQGKYTLGDLGEKTIASILIEDFNNEQVIVIQADEQMVLSLSDEGIPDGNFVMVTLPTGEIMTGSNFLVNESGASVSLSGQVATTNGVTKNLSIYIHESQVGAGDSTYIVEGDRVFFSGTLGTLTFNQILEINEEFPAVKIIVLLDISGSVNDEVNVQTGRIIREAGYNMHLMSTSEIYSGGVDLFCSGKKRTMENGAKIGVHSWCCFQGLPANQISEDSQGHHSQITYFKEMLGDVIGKEFYFFTINAADFDQIHLMTANEIAYYQLLKN